MWHSTESNLIIEYLREYEFIFLSALVHESGDPGVLFAKKTEGQKSSETVPFSSQKISLNFFIIFSGGKVYSTLVLK
jgi:hypothetical protein